MYSKDFRRPNPVCKGDAHSLEMRLRPPTCCNSAVGMMYVASQGFVCAVQTPIAPAGKRFLSLPTGTLQNIVLERAEILMTREHVPAEALGNGIVHSKSRIKELESWAKLNTCHINIGKLLVPLSCFPMNATAYKWSSIHHSKSKEPVAMDFGQP